MFILPKLSDSVLVEMQHHKVYHCFSFIPVTMVRLIASTIQALRKQEIVMISTDTSQYIDKGLFISTLPIVIDFFCYTPDSYDSHLAAFIYAATLLVLGAYFVALKLVHDVELNPGPRRKNNVPVRQAVGLGLFLVVYISTISIVSFAADSFFRHSGIYAIADDLGAGAAAGLRERLATILAFLQETREQLSYETDLRTRLQSLVDLRSNMVSARRAGLPSRAVVEMFSYNHDQSSVIALMHDIETNPGPITPVRIAKPDGTIYFNWFSQGKASRKFFQKNRALFDELGALLYTEDYEDNPRFRELTDFLSATGLLDMRPKLKFPQVCKPEAYKEGFFKEPRARPGAFKALRAAMRMEAKTSDDFPEFPKLESLGPPPITTKSNESSDECPNEVKTTEDLSADPAPMKELLDRLFDYSEGVAAEAAALGKETEAEIIRTFIDKLRPMKPQMFSLPGLPELTVNVSDTTKEWMADLVKNLTGAFSEGTKANLTFMGLDFSNIDWASPTTMGLALIVVYVGFKTSSMPLTDLGKGILGLIAVIMVVKYGGTYLEQVYTKLSGLLSDESQGMKEQTGGWHEEICTLVCGAVYYLVYKTTPPAKLLVTFIKTIGDLPKFKSGLGESVTMVIELLRSFVNWLSTFPGLEGLMTLPVQSERAVLLARSLNVLMSELRAGAPYDAFNADRLFAIEGELREVLVGIPKTKEFSMEVHCIENLLRTVQGVAPMFVGFAKNGPRKAPLAVFITGPSGVGKSVNQRPLISSVAARVLSDADFELYCLNPNNSIFNRMTEAEFFEGFFGQPIWTLEEVGQVKDSASNPDPGIFELIRLNNVAPYLLNFAHLENKGNSYAAPKLVFGTSNVRSFKIDSVLDREAYIRRWDVQLLQVPKPEYCVNKPEENEFETGRIWDRRLCHSKLPGGGEELDLDISEFYKYDASTGQVLDRQPMYFWDVDDDDPRYQLSVVKYIVDIYAKKNNIGTKLLELHKTHLDQLNIRRQSGNIKPLMQAQAGDEDDAVIVRYARALGVTPEIVRSTYEKHSLSATTSVKTFCACFKSDHINPLLDVALSALESITSTLSNKTVLAGIAATLTVAGAIWMFTKNNFVVQSGGVKRAAVKHKVPTRTRTAMKPQGPRITKNDGDMMNLVFKHNLYMVEPTRTDKVVSKFGYAVMLGGRVGVTCKHFYDRTKELYSSTGSNTCWKFSKVFGDYSIEVPFSEIEENIVCFSEDSEDLIFFKLPPVCIMHKSIRHFFRQETDKVFEHPFHMSLYRGNNPESGFNTTGAMAVPITEITASDNQYHYNFVTAFRYGIVTENGECGSPGYITDSISKRPSICSLHVAGDGKVGIGVPIFQNSVDSAFLHFSEKPIADLEFFGELKEQGGIPSKFIVAKEVKSMSNASKTQIVRAPLYGLMGSVDKKPAHLRPMERDGIIIDPLYKSRTKYNQSVLAMNTKLLDYATSFTKNQVLNTCPGETDVVPPRLWTFEDAVYGTGEIGSLNFSGSSGYPFGFRGRKKRDWLCDNKGEIDLSTPKAVELRESVNSSLSLLAQGKDPEFLFMDNPKDETRPIEKVDNFETRLISGEPIDLSIIVRMLFGSFIEKTQKDAIFNGVGIGINPYSTDWSALARMLKSVSNKMLAGDHKGYDGRFRASLWLSCLSIVESYYYNSTPEEVTMRRTLIELMITSVHVAPIDSEGERLMVAYWWEAGMPSGFSLTALFDSIGGLVINRYAVYTVLMEDYGGHLCFDGTQPLNFSEVDKNLAMIQGGDDNIIAIGPYLEELGVNQTSVTQAFAEMGWSYTDEEKGSVSHILRPLEDIKFYKRGFVWSPVLGRHLCPLDWSSIDDRLNFIKTSAAPGDYERNIRSAVLEYAEWGPEVFRDRALNKVIRAAKEQLNIHDLPEKWEIALEEVSKISDIFM